MKNTITLYFRIVGFLVCCSFAAVSLQAQDLGNVVQQARSLGRQPLEITGGMSFSNNSYFSNGIDPRRDALQWRIMANLNLSYAGITAPFSLAFSDANRQFNLPSYAFTGISPTYKWARLHLGDRNIDFSKYTLNAINFRGVGLELQPGRFYFGSMYGQLRRAVAEDFQSQQNLDPSFRRMGYGFKAGYAGEGFEYRLMVFGAYDEPGSIQQPTTRLVLPGDNAVVSLHGNHQLAKKIGVEVEIARSASNLDRRLDLLTTTDQNIGNTLLGLLKPTVSVQSGTALRSKISYQARGFGLNGGYERIERGFKTMGALFFLSDVEYITAGINKSLFKSKLNLFTNGGVERTNIDDFRKNGTQRLVGSLNASYSPGERWAFNGSFSNFQNTSKLRAFTDPTALVDSIILAQTTQTANIAFTYNIASEGNPSSLTLALTQQQANSIVDDVVQNDAETRFFNGSLIYSLSIPKKDMRFNSSVNVNQTSLAGFNNFVLSPNISLTKGFLDKRLQTNARVSYNHVFIPDGQNTAVLNFGLGGSWQLNKLHSLSLNTNFINRFSTTDTAGYSELFGQLMYNYRFSRNLRLSAQAPAPSTGTPARQ
jgi:hypothetical protein